MPKAILTIGCVASGKSTFAKKHCQDHPEWVRISRDDLRHARGTYWRPKDEDLITKWEYSCIKDAIEYGKSVVIDEMNLNPKYRNKLVEYLKSLGVTDITFKEFLDVPLEELIKRDRQRPFSIGEKVIREHYNKYIKKDISVKQDPNLPHICLVDLDGTLALFGNRNPYDRDFINDEVNVPVQNILNNYGNEFHKVFIFSGRTERFKEETITWLKKHKINYHFLCMRTKEQENAQIKDVVVKQEMFDKHVRDKYYVDFVIDDRLQVCRLWNSLGLPLLRFGDPDADF